MNQCGLPDVTSLKKNRSIFFTCNECVHHISALDSELYVSCHHPAVKAQNFSASTYSLLSANDWPKIDELINVILQVKLNLLGDTATNFSFPFRYNPIWIVGCAGFEGED